MTHLDLDQVDWLHEPWLSCELRGIDDSACRGDDLPAPSVDGIRMQRHIMDVETYPPHVLLTQDTLRKRVFFSGGVVFWFSELVSGGGVLWFSEPVSGGGVLWI